MMRENTLSDNGSAGAPTLTSVPSAASSER
jgi:hypothetical protein